MDNRISKGDKFRIFWRAGIKALRRVLKPFLTHSDGVLLIGKGVQITHGKHIACIKRVKFEDYSEKYGLCSDGLVLGNDETIVRKMMVTILLLFHLSLWSVFAKARDGELFRIRSDMYIGRSTDRTVLIV